ncbi:MAG: cysteine hydrolase family protein [Actinomycetota bacterium]|nr:cysteine hydrolase family protein [Actinomycetota bacterium]
MTTDSRPASTERLELQPEVWVAGSTPYPWPYDAKIQPATLALIVIVPGGAAPGITPAAGDAAMASITTLAHAVIDFGATVLHVTTASPVLRAGLGATDTDGSAGGEWSPPAELPFPATTLNAVGIDGFFGSQLDSVLRSSRITHLLLAGLPLETAVHSTMRAANDMGYECLLVEDSTAALDPDLKRNTLSMVEMSGGIFGAIGTTAAVLAALEL